MNDLSTRKKDERDVPLPIPGDGPAEVFPYRRNFGIFLLSLCLISCIVLRPLLHGIAWGAVFAYLWHPVHSFVSRRRQIAKYPNLAAAASCVLLLITFTIPLVFTIQAILAELASVYDTSVHYIATLRETGLPSLDAFLPESVAEWVRPFLADKERIAGILTSLAQSTANFLQNLSRGVLHWTGSFMFQGFIAIMTMFFLIRDWETVTGYIRDFIPLPDDEREKFVAGSGAIMNSVVYGVILTVGVQALLGGVGWWFVGLGNAFLASAAMFIFGMFPAGTSVVWLPGGVYLIATGSVGAGLSLIVWGVLVVSTIDNFLRPVLIGGGGAVPTLAIILGLTGGLAVWGLLGVFLGPLVLALSLSVLDLYRSRLRSAAGASHIRQKRS